MLAALATFAAVVVVTLGVSPGPLAAPPASAEPAGDRKAMVQLFQWPWKSVAAECENVLGPKGFGGVQISPPHEHVVLPNAGQGGYPWWQDYQPVSYPNPNNNGDFSKLKTRRGDLNDFKDMISRCHAQGVKIYADALINHTTGANGGIGSAGTTFPDKYTYPGTFSPQDFHDCKRDIKNYQDRWEVQNCELAALADLKTESSYVRTRIAKYLKDLASLGVDGFRLDAAKHIPAGDLLAIVNEMRSQISNDPGFPANGVRNPYVYQEVLFGAGEPIHPNEYQGSGDLKEVQFGDHISQKFWNASTRDDGIHGLHAYPNGWGDRMQPGSKAIVMIDNHDSQRDALSQANGGYDRKILTYKDGARYKLANVFMMGWDYGTPLLMSSFAFTTRDTSPPRTSDGTTKQVDCGTGEWVCEHRWSEMADMVGFRNAVAGTTVSKTLPQDERDWYSDYTDGTAGGKVAFSRGNKGYVVINRDQGSGWNRTYKTRLPAGTYCNVINGNYNAQTRTCGNANNIIQVQADGTFQANVPSMSALAIHVGALHSPGQAEPVDTTFNLTGNVPAGETAYVVGNVPQLGGDNESNAIALTASGGTRSAVVQDLPPNTSVTYRYFTKKADGTVTRDPYGSRTFQTPNGGTATRSDTWGDAPNPVEDVKVNFTVTASTVSGQDVYVVGNTAELGNWNPANAVKLNTDQSTYPTWRGSVTLKPNTAVAYKYIKKNGGQVVWEEGADRTFTTPANGELPRNDGSFRGDSPSTGVTGKYNLQAHTVVGQDVYVVGNIPELGNWNPAHAVKLNTDAGTYPHWSGSAALPANTPIAYKYIIKKDNDPVIWEQGGNRTATTTGSGEHVFNDGWFRR
ncbi:alpha-amylase [Thermomonospora echinospora]|uniref:Alpha-amylase n=1 Tax=Thermomonospora echinospora TaxID=1992 RepID=A0A1H5XFL0_9ACTN|nr:carbohydrate-binding module family 20 domain-containing protein [Thermomonospora echinospora]SEG10489.1 alpha-amylase [Thermomonospora echinospora]